MRFMIIVKANAETESGAMPSSENIAAMGRFNEELIEAGVLLAAEGLHSSDRGFKARKAGGKVSIIDGPFAEAKEMIAGFWMLQVKSRDEVLAWVRRIPLEEGEEVEVRQVHEASDFVVDDLTAKHLEREKAFRDAAAKPAGR